MRKLQLLLAPLVMFSGAAYSINKCTDAHGRISYQEQACSPASKATTVDLPAPPIDPTKQWRFTQERDAMTGASTCFAISPVVYTNWSRGMVTHSVVFMQVAVPKGGTNMAITVRSYESDNHSLFHIKTDGQGIKVEGGTFYPLIEKFGSHALSPAAATMPELLGELGKSDSVKLRVRFWPYDTLHDTDPIPLANFKNATLAAMKCAL